MYNYIDQDRFGNIVFIQVGEQCLSDQWPPKPDRALPTYVVNLDAPPIERWKAVTTTYKAEVKRMLYQSIYTSF